MKTLSFILIAITVASSSCAQNPKVIERPVGGNCEDCQIMFKEMPSKLSLNTKIADDNEEGERLVITGIVYQKDGKTPASNVILYVYHTNSKGVYPNSERKNNPHGNLRGWIKTDASGKYQLYTIRPASYPSSKAPQHIHAIIKESNTSAYWIDEYLFADDPYLNDTVRKQQRLRGGSGIISPKRDSKGTWIAERNIILGLNIPSY